MNDIEANARSLSARVGQRLLEQGKMLALAESCTGGLVASYITDIAGSSVYFLGSAVTYAYEAKEQVLGVSHETLMMHGAVSAETAGEMARGARRLFGADLALSVTGIAGPGGATPQKPVGLVCIHLSAPDAEIDEQHVWPLDRIGNKLLSAQAVLALALRYLEGDPSAASLPPNGNRDSAQDEDATAVSPSASPGGTDFAQDGDKPHAEIETPIGNLPDFPDEPVVVDVRLLRDGGLVPSRFTFRGRRYAVLSVGRQWQEESSGATWRCYLVQTPALPGARGPATFELRHDPVGDAWRVARAWGADVTHET